MNSSNSLRMVGAIVIAAIAALGVEVVWEVILAINIRVSPHVGWYPYAAALLVLILLAVLGSWLSRSLLPSTPTNSRIILFASCSTIACACFNLLLAIWSAEGFAGAARPSLTNTGLVRSYIIVAPVFAALVEEVLFRGVIQPAAERALGLFTGITITSALFVAAHYANPDLGIQWPFYFMFSVVMGLLSWRTESLLYPIAAHVALNLCGSLPIYLKGAFYPAQLGNAWHFGLFATFICAAWVAVLAGLHGVRAKLEPAS